MNVARTIILVIGAAYLVTGAVLLVAPESYLETVGISAAGRLALSDMRALYGGLELALGALIIAFGRRRGNLGIAAVLAIAAFGGLVLGRLAGLLLDGLPESGLQVGIMLFEVAGLVLSLLVALRAARG